MRMRRDCGVAVKNGGATGRNPLRMSQDATTPELADPAAQAADLKARLGAFVDGLVRQDDAAYEDAFVEMLTRVRGLVDRKLRMEGSKSDTRDVLGELLFTRLRQAMLQFARSDDARQAQKAAEWVMAAMFAVRTLSEFARAFDECLLRAAADARDFNFAGRTDFISVEEVLQMLSAGKHRGCLSLEKADNRLDIYLKDGRIVLLDPHRIARRVLPGGDSMRHREIPEQVVHDAEAARARDGSPALLTLVERGVFKPEEARDQLRAFGKETLYEFMREEQPYAFVYRRLDALPAAIEANDVRLGVTSTLLEGSKQNDDWKQLQAAFPDLDAPIEPRADMFARMGTVPLSVLEIKLLSLIQGDTTPRSLVGQLGIPIFEVCQTLARLAKAGILTPGGGARSLDAVGGAATAAGVQASLREAFQALDANDDQRARTEAVERVFGDAAPRAALTALDKVLGGWSGPGGDAAGDLDRELLGLLKKPAV